jgi:multidrug efflux pump subunit AcrA (membrane-fusion protein)
MSIALAGVVLSGVAGWCAGTRVQSSSEAELSTRPPAASPITAEVEQRELASTIVTRGTVRYNDPVAVTLASGSAGGTALVTREPVAGTELNEGTVMMEVSGQPVFALAGDRPMYRDIRPGDTGDDVRQLEEALQRMGFDPGAVDGRFDGATASAIEAWYESASYRASGATDEEREQLRSARDAVSAAQQQLRNAERALQEGSEPPSASDLARAHNALAAAQDAVDQAITAEAQNNARAADDILDAEAALENAEDAADAQEEAAQRAVELAELALASAQQALEDAQSDTTLPPAQHDAAVDQAQREVDMAELELQDAEAALDQVEDEGADAIASAERVLDGAHRNRDAVAQQGEAAVRGAQGELELARLSLEELLTPPDVTSLQEAVADAETDLERARTELAELEDEIGTYVPASNVVFFRELPLRIDSVSAERGAPVSGSPMTVSGSRLAVESAVSLADAELIRTGMTVELSAPDLGIDLEGEITDIADTPGTNGLDDQHVYVEITPTEPPPNFKDAAVRVTIPVQATEGEVLAVPVAAVSVAAAGSDRVEVLEEDGSRRFVTVTAGLSAEGLVQVTPLDGELGEGDLVIVGDAGAKE